MAALPEQLFGHHGIERPLWSHFKENPALCLTSFLYLLTTLIRPGGGKANKTGRMDYLHSCERFLSDGVEWIEPWVDRGSRGCLSFTFVDALSTAGVLVTPPRSARCRLQGHELRPEHRALGAALKIGGQDRRGYAPARWHPKDRPYGRAVKAAHCPSPQYGLPESVSFGGARASDLSTAEALLDPLFSSRVKIKRDMKCQVRILA